MTVISDPTQTRTLRPLREAVEALGFDLEALAGETLVKMAADVVVEMRPAVAEDGSVFVSCGGEALFAFYPSRRGTTFPDVITRTGTPFYLVRDSRDADAWDWKARSEFEGIGAHAAHALGPKPRVRLRIVKAA